MKDYLRHQRGRMFESDFFEFFSKVHPATPFIFWIPIGVGVLGYALFAGITSALKTVALFPLGFFTWQVLEYFIHKKIFHWTGIGPISRRFHDIVHGFHHKYPDDDSRLVMPLAVSISLASAIGGGLYLLHRPDITVPFWAGLLFGYLWYDFLHWSTHFRKPLTAWGRRLRGHHMSHHFADPESNFGISNLWLDRLMGTLRKRSAPEEANEETR
jgi:sterol desaturase/sphingolipid hydroxylase (fatty acid hydroxylase superfamily)